LRDTNPVTRDHAEAAIRSAGRDIAARRRVSIAFETINSDPPATCAPALVETICAAATAHGFSVRRMISRAYHDSLFMAQVCPTAMIFIPCRNGWSHRPDEFASDEAVARGVEVLAESLKSLSV
jgi:acetylornithine deacetylase/succinyl-diaminopimelate desuccinylase-like protein